MTMYKNSKKKILVLTSTFPRWKNDIMPPFVYELSKRIAKKYEVYIIAPHYPGAKKYEIMEEMKIYRFKYCFDKWEKLSGDKEILQVLKSNKLNYFLIITFVIVEIIALIKIMIKFRPTVIIAHWIIPQGFSAICYKKIFRDNKIKIICVSHGGDIFGLRKLNFIKKWIVNNCNVINVVSKAIKSEVLKMGVRKNLLIRVISMGVDEKKFNPQQYDRKLKKRYKIKGPLLLFVGRLAEKKGVKYLIIAMKDVIRKIPEAKLLIIGTGALEEELKIFTKRLDLEDNILFLGGIPNHRLPKYYATADIFIGPSIISEGGDREGLPVTFMEAMACGCPVIATDLSGNRDIIINGINGCFIRQKDSKDIEDKIISRLKNRWNRNKIADFIKNNYSWKVIVNKYLHELS